jgi:hypothetical protein
MDVESCSGHDSAPMKAAEASGTIEKPAEVGPVQGDSGECATGLLS